MTGDQGARSVWRGVKVKRAILTGLICNFASFIVGGGFYFLVFSKFRPEMAGPFAAILRWTPAKAFEMPSWWWAYLIIGNTILAIVIAFVYAILCEGLPGRGVWKGVWFGFLVWLAALLPVAFTLGAIVEVSATLTTVAAIEPLTEYVIYGALIAWIYGEPVTEEGPGKATLL